MEASKAFPLAEIKKKRQPKLYTLGEYLDYEERTKDFHAYYNGKLKKLPMAKGPHNIIIANLAFALKFALKNNKLDFIVMSGQQKVYMPELNYANYPDVLVVCEKPEYFDDNQQLLINPVLVIEVLSKSTRKYDESDKFTEYKTLNSLREYVLIDQDQPNIEARFQEEPNLWRFETKKGSGQKLVLKSLGIELLFSDIYENALKS